MTWETFKKQMAYLTICFNQELESDVLNIYWRNLKLIPDDQFQKVCQLIIKEFVPTSTVKFPVVAHFISNCGESINDKANRAINKLKIAIWRVGLYNSVDFLDPALNLVVVSSGGWPSMCNWTSKEWDINEGRLKESYMSFIKNGSGRTDHLPGLSEKSGGFFKLYIAGKKENMVEFKKYDDPEELINDLDYKNRKQDYYQKIGYQYLLK